ncbi:hypothetical protein KRMM14A1259_68340 [Krasilnikovia sp. MM14-A1259]
MLADMIMIRGRLRADRSLGPATCVALAGTVSAVMAARLTGGA